ncbi:hypothetical protein SRHO_G00258940 [Serrasalmus rhombeus]
MRPIKFSGTALGTAGYYKSPIACITDPTSDDYLSRVSTNVKHDLSAKSFQGWGAVVCQDKVAVVLRLAQAGR